MLIKSVELKNVKSYHHETVEFLEGINGITFGNTLQSSPHKTAASCVGCHMAPSPAEIGSTVKNILG